MLNDVSINMMVMAPKINAIVALKPKFPAFGSKNITMADTTVPIIRYGIRRPNRFHVLSDKRPIIGCTNKPAAGGRIKNQPSECGSAPSVCNSRPKFELCNENPICTPKNAKLNIQMVCNGNVGSFWRVPSFVIFVPLIKSIVFLFANVSALFTNPTIADPKIKWKRFLDVTGNIFAFPEWPYLVHIFVLWLK